ncbi:uncharacterized protein LOC119114368 [Pollicipes pollicipes]|uniref:uncharacterized protein LOC119114366 n=1 Tax=Pollicipes pollicipes TaxID=41117 RepID=UPI0018849CD1|nr:uncharacterized protein LOC119114366 [Pollicipes pollicipes]XP_037094460.1 uncharacterized protein LOC119114368 [Pollicipes pollicipes]
MELELRTGGAELEAICYRAVQACPWSKHAHLYLAGRQLARACDLMSRAGLRLRLPLEELDLLLEEEPELAAERAAEESERAAELADRALRTEGGRTGTAKASRSDLETDGDSESADGESLSVSDSDSESLKSHDSARGGESDVGEGSVGELARLED